MLKQLDRRLSIHVYAAACLSRTASAPFPSPDKGSSVTSPVVVTRLFAKVSGHLHPTLVPSTAATSTSANSAPNVR